MRSSRGTTGQVAENSFADDATDACSLRGIFDTFLADSSTSRRRNLVHGPKHLSCIERREDGLGGVRNLGTVRGGKSNTTINSGS